jgi:hypothetical protein
LRAAEISLTFPRRSPSNPFGPDRNEGNDHVQCRIVARQLRAP